MNKFEIEVVSWHSSTKFILETELTEDKLQEAIWYKATGDIGAVDIQLHGDNGYVFLGSELVKHSIITVKPIK